MVEQHLLEVVDPYIEEAVLNKISKVIPISVKRIVEHLLRVLNENGVQDNVLNGAIRRPT